jgi:hypothetical protein
LENEVDRKKETDFMRSFFIALAALTAVVTLAPTTARADPYRWCAEYGGMDGDGGRNCGFVTLDQCRAAISGVGGFCEPNPFYTGPEKRTRRSYRPHDRYDR